MPFIIMLFLSCVLYPQTAIQFSSPQLYYEELNKIIDSLIVIKPNLITKKVYGISALGTECFAVKISDNVHTNEAEPEVAFDAGTHADEWVAMGILNKLMRDLIVEYDIDSTIKKLVDSREIWIYPKSVIDGKTRDFKMPDGVYVNMNRDWGFGGWSTPFQLEYTRYLADWLLDNRFVYHWSGHDGQQDIRYFNSLDVDHYKFLAERYQSIVSYLTLNRTYVDPYLGRTFSYGVMGTLAFVCEVNSQKDAVDSIAPRYAVHKPAMLDMITLAGCGVRGMITDAQSGSPVKTAQIWVEDATQKRLKPVYGCSSIGDYHRYLIPGEYKVWVSANGYVASEPVTITVTDGDATEIDFQMEPLSTGGHYGYRTIVKMTSLTAYQDRPTMVDTWKHLGAPDSIGYRLGKRGYVVMDMGSTYRVHPDSFDLVIYENDVSSKGYKVEVSSDWMGPWTFVGSDTGTAYFDIADVDSFRYVRIEDAGDGILDSTATDACFNLDAIEVLSRSAGSVVCEAAPEIEKNYIMNAVPNPFNPSTTIYVDIPKNMSEKQIYLIIYDLGGKLIHKTSLSPDQTGRTVVKWNGQDTKGMFVSSGMYFARLTGTKASSDAMRLIMVR